MPIKGQIRQPESPTIRQIAAVRNMQQALGIKESIPTTKVEACALIDKLKTSISNNLQATGRINPSGAWKEADERFEDYGVDFLDEIY